VKKLKAEYLGISGNTVADWMKDGGTRGDHEITLGAAASYALVAPTLTDTRTFSTSR
jgi:hypothetical protein